MEISAVDSKTGKTVKAMVQEPPAGFFVFVAEFDWTSEQLQARIEQMDVSADMKAFLYSFSQATIKAGKAIVKIGRKLIDLVFAILDQFPHMTFGAIFGFLIGALFSAIPLIGVVLGPIALPLAIGFGITLGAKVELEAGDLGARVKAILAEFAPLRAGV